MQTRGISRRDYERLPADTKLKAIGVFEAIKSELRHRGFSLNFLGFDGRWKDLTPWKFLEFSEDNYRRLIAGANMCRLRLVDRAVYFRLVDTTEGGLFME